MTDVAVIGLGIMGHAMADHFLHTVGTLSPSGTARPPRPTTWWRRGPIGPPVRPRRPRRLRSVTFEVTADDGSSRSAWLGGDGILEGARPGSVLVASATLSPPWVAELAEACAAAGHPFLDMPLTGGRAGAESGQLVMLAGGDAETLAELAPTLAAVASDVKHFGPVGAGTRFKLILNAVQAVHLGAFGEAMRMAEATGLDAAAVGAALVERPGGVVTAMADAAFGQDDTPVSFPLRWAAKDLAYAAAMAEAANVAHPLVAAAGAALARGVDDGHGQADWTVVNRTRRDLAP